MNPSLCNVCPLKNLGTKGVAMQYIPLRKRWAAELEELVKTAALN
jgi:hypothetical protein